MQQLGLFAALRATAISQPLMRELHWLPVKQRVHFKILLITFKVIHSIACLIVWWNCARNTYN